MIKELLEKRTSDYIETTKKILDIYEENLTRAIRFFAKTDKDIQITSVYLYPTNSNFIVNSFKVDVDIGDKIRTPDGKVVIVTTENKNSLYTDDMSIIVPISLLETGTAIQLYEEINRIDAFIQSHGNEKFYKVISSGIKTFDDILTIDNTELLEELTNPIDIILESLDELQKVQYNLFSNDSDRRLH